MAAHVRAEPHPVQRRKEIVMADDALYTGGCLCGALRYAARGAPMNVRVCHCRLCQKATGAPFFARALFRREAVTITGAVAEYNSSPAIRRGSCPVCGTRLFTRSDTDPPRIGIGLATLDEPAALPPTEHIFVASRIPWVRFDDGLPEHAERPPA
jgi:hypothetical protein